MPDQLAAMDAQQLREFAAGLIERIARHELPRLEQRHLMRKLLDLQLLVAQLVHPIR